MTAGEILGYVGLGIWIFVAILVIFGALKGRSRGILRQSVRTITIVASIIIAFVTTKSAYDTFTAEIQTMGLAGSLGNYAALDAETQKILSYIEPETANHVLAIPMALLIIPIMFVASFWLLSVVLYILHIIVCKIAGFAKWKNNKLTRLFGAILGAVQGLAVAIVLLVLPIGLASTASGAIADMGNNNSQTTADVKEVYVEYVQPLAEHSSLTTLGALGGNALYDGLSTVTVNGQTFCMADEIASPVLKIVGSIDLLSEIDFENMSEEDKAAFNVIIDIVDESPYMETLIVRVLDNLATAIVDGNIIEDEESAKVLKPILSVFTEMESEHVVPTLELIRDSIFLINGFDDIDGLEKNRDAINALLDSIEENEYKKSLLANLLDAFATVVIDSADGDETVAAVLSIFVDIDPDDVAPTLELIIDTAFLLSSDLEFDEETVNALIESIGDNERKADILATMLSSVAASLKTDGETDDDAAMNNILSVFEGIKGESVIPTLELLRDAMFMVSDDFDFEDIADETSEASVKFKALIDSISESTAKQNSLATMLDAIANAAAEDDGVLAAIFGVFDDIEGPEVVPTLEIMLDAMFMTGLDWDTISNEDSRDRAKLEALIDSVETDLVKAEVLATILDAVVDSVDDGTDDTMKTVLDIFDDIEPANVAPTLELLLDATFMLDVEWDNLKDESHEDRVKFDALLDSIEGNTVKQNALATMLDAVADEQESDGDDMMSAIIGIFDGIEGSEVAPTLEIMIDSLFLTDVDWESLTDEDKDDLDNLILSAKGNEPKEEALAILLDAISDTFTVENSGSGEDISGEFVESIFSVFSGINEIPDEEKEKNGVIPTLEVVRDVLFMLDEEKLGEGDDAKTVLQVLSSNDTGNGQLSEVFSRKDENGDTLIRRVNGRLDDTDNTAGLVTSMTKISLSVMSDSKDDSTGSTTITTETYDNVNAGLKDIVSVNQKYENVELEKDTPEYEEYVGEVSSTLESTFTENGIEVEEDVVNDMAEYVADNYKDKVEELTDSEVNDIILSYYEAYLKQQAGNN